VTLKLSSAEARRLILAAQGLVGADFGVTPAAAVKASAARRERAVGDVLGHLGAVQLDTISVLARSHQLVPFARLGPVGRETVDSAYWGIGDGPARTFEYWSHAACVLPVGLWPWFAFRRRWYRRRGIRWHEVPPSAVDAVRAQLAEQGPLTTREIGGAKSSSEWWDWSESKVAIEFLLDVGEVVCARREGWRRVYDLAERALPRDILDAPDPDDDACVRQLVLLGARAMGVGTVGDILDVHRLSGRYTSREHVTEVFADLVDSGELTEVSVRGWRGRSYADARLLGAGSPRGRHRTTLLSPFDSLIWHRGRTEQVFGFEHLFEPYVPRARRQHGYFTMPVLHGGQLVARVDPKRSGRTLEAITVLFETGAGTGAESGRVPRSAVEGTARALAEAAAWVGCEGVALGAVRPSSCRAALQAALD